MWKKEQNIRFSRALKLKLFVRTSGQKGCFMEIYRLVFGWFIMGGCSTGFLDEKSRSFKKKKHLLFSAVFTKTCLNYPAIRLPVCDCYGSSLNFHVFVQGCNQRAQFLGVINEAGLLH